MQSRLKSPVGSAIASSWIFLIACPSAHAAGEVLVHARLGLIFSNISGPASGSMAVPLSLDAEVEQPRTPDRSVFVRTIVAYDFGQSLVRYLSVGAGMRYFVGLPKQQLLHTEAPATTVKSPAETARFHFYYGWSGGMSQVVLRVVTPALQTVAQMIEV